MVKNGLADLMTNRELKLAGIEKSNYNNCRSLARIALAAAIIKKLTKKFLAGKTNGQTKI